MSQTEISPIFSGKSGSLISRISRGLTSRAKNKLSINDIFSPTSTNFDSISTIKADDFLFDKQEDSWNIQHRSASPNYKGKSASPIISSGRQTSLSHSHDLNNIEVPSVCFRDDVSKCCVKHISHHNVIEDPSPRRLQRMRVQGIGAAEVQRGISISWEISPSKENPVRTSKNEQPKESENQSLHAPSIRDANQQRRDVMDSSRPNLNKAGEDQWREARDPESGRTYYYNRRTRVSKWRLPSDVIVKKKDSNRRHAEKSGTMIPIPSLIPQYSDRRADSGKKILHVSLSSDEDKLNNTRSSSHEEHQSSIGTRTMNLDLSTSSVLNQSQMVQKMPLLEDKVNPICPTMNEKTRGIDEIEQAGRIKPTQNDSATQLSKANPLMSPRNSMPNSIFCLYCGCNCESVALLSSHLSQCTRFTYMQRHQRSTQIDLEIILFRAWSQLGIKSTPDVGDSSEFNTPSHKLSSTRQEEGEDVARSSISQKSHPVIIQTPTLRNNKHVNAKPYYGIESKKCPFCNGIFGTGNGFSSHLLVCTVRRQVRKQRQNKNKNSPVPLTVDPRRKYVTPGRRMPWE